MYVLIKYNLKKYVDIKHYYLLMFKILSICRMWHKRVVLNVCKVKYSDWNLVK